MTEKNAFAPVEEVVASILEGPEADLLSLTRMASLDPGSDFRNADLRQIDLSGEDLTAFDFRGADLRQANLTGATIYRSALEGALLERAALEGLNYLDEDSLPLWGDAADWSLISLREAPPILTEEISPIDGRYLISEKTTKVRVRHLPWYGNDAALFALNDRSHWPKRLVVYYLVQRDGSLQRLNGTSPPIHDVNANVPIKLSDENVLDYLRFFCFFVRGEEGPFYIAENIDDPLIPTHLDETTHSVIAGTVRPARLSGRDESGQWLVDATVFYSNVLFIANFAINANGLCEMLDDEPIAADLPVRIDAPVA